MLTKPHSIVLFLTKSIQSQHTGYKYHTKTLQVKFSKGV